MQSPLALVNDDVLLKVLGFLNRRDLDQVHSTCHLLGSLSTEAVAMRFIEKEVRRSLNYLQIIFQNLDLQITYWEKKKKNKNKKQKTKTKNKKQKQKTKQNKTKQTKQNKTNKTKQNNKQNKQNKTNKTNKTNKVSNSKANIKRLYIYIYTYTTK